MGQEGVGEADQVVLLQQEIDFLGGVITRKDEALEEIRHFFHPKDPSLPSPAASLLSKAFPESSLPPNKEDFNSEGERMAQELSEAVGEILGRSHSAVAELTQKYQLSKLARSGVVAQSRKGRGSII